MEKQTIQLNKIIQGDCLEKLKELPDNSVDAIVTDPPYGLEFMGKSWDGSGIEYNINLWIECLRVLKPGGFLLSFGGTRTYHRMACAIEDAGFEIRDMISWIYGSGFPKSLNIGKQIDKINGNEREFVKKDNNFGSQTSGIYELNTTGKNKTEWNVTKGSSEYEGWGTALKPACEPIVVARKPLSEKNVALNVLKWGTGGINIDESRIGTDMIPCSNDIRSLQKWKEQDGRSHKELINPEPTFNQGRFPANIILECICDKLGEQTEKIIGGFGAMKIGISNTGEGITQDYDSSKSKTKENTFLTHTNPNCPCYMLDEQSGISKSSDTKRNRNTLGSFGMPNDLTLEYSDKGGASRFFYCAKASKSERNYGTDSFINIEVFNMICENKQQEKSLIQGERLVKLSVDMETLQERDIGESGMQEKKDLEWNTILFGKEVMEKYQKDFQSIIKTKTNSTILLKTWNWLMHLLTKEYIVDAKELKENGINLVENVNQSKELIVTMNEKLVSALGVKNVVSGMQLKIRLSEGKCDHPTVKPIKLMEYLVKLVTPKNGVCLDPFLGSGTTAIACIKNRFKYIGIEKEEEYVKIANARINTHLIQEKLI